MDRHYEKLRWNPNVNRILAQRGFQKIRALMKIFFIRKSDKETKNMIVWIEELDD